MFYLVWVVIMKMMVPLLLSISINLVLSIASGLKGQIPVFLNPFSIVARLIYLSKDSLKIAVKFVLCSGNHQSHSKFLLHL